MSVCVCVREGNIFSYFTLCFFRTGEYSEPRSGALCDEAQ